MTLYGPSKGLDETQDLKNVTAWNAWAGRHLNAEQRQKRINKSKMRSLPGLGDWKSLGAEIEELFAKKARAAGIGQSMPKTTDEIDLAGLRINYPLHLGRALFRGRVKMGGIQLQELSLTGCVFDKSFDLTDATLTGLTLTNSVFKEQLIAEGLDLRGPVDTYGARFGSVNFEANTFTHDTSFAASTFGGSAKFKRCIFEDRAHFTGAEFAVKANFYAAEFQKRAVFSDCTFVNVADFAVAQFKENAYFRDARFGKFEPTDPCEVSFRDARFERPVVFLNARFLSSAPEFQGADLHPRVSFTAKEGDEKGPFWPKTHIFSPFKIENWKALATWVLERCPTDASDEANRNSFAMIRHAVANQGLPEEEHFFFRREMHYAGKAAPFWQKLPYKAFWFLSDYGWSIGWPFAWLALLWEIGFFVFLNAEAKHCPSAAEHSLANIFNFFGFLRAYYPGCTSDLSNGLAAFSGLQTALSFILLFFLGLGLRQRFRLR